MDEIAYGIIMQELERGDSGVRSFVSVQSTSMFSTLRPGDLLLVKRWTRWTGADPGDIVVFRDPLKDHQPLSQRPLMVKRVVAGPGDKMEIRRGRLLLNGKPVPDPEGTTYSYLVRLRAGAAPETLLQRMGLPLELAHGGDGNLELPLNGALAARAKEDADVVSVSAMRLASGARPHVFPFSPRYPWNGDDYGPVTVPAAGDTLHINVDNLPLYDRLMSVYEGHRIGANGSQLTFYDGTRCLGSSGPPGPTPGPHADVAVLPHQTHPPEAPPGIGADSCRCHGAGEHLTYALDELLHHLLTAA